MGWSSATTIRILDFAWISDPDEGPFMAALFSDIHFPY